MPALHTHAACVTFPNGWQHTCSRGPALKFAACMDWPSMHLVFCMDCSFVSRSGEAPELYCICLRAVYLASSCTLRGHLHALHITIVTAPSSRDKFIQLKTLHVNAPLLTSLQLMECCKLRQDRCLHASGSSGFRAYLHLHLWACPLSLPTACCSASADTHAHGRNQSGGTTACNCDDLALEVENANMRA